MKKKNVLCSILSLMSVVLVACGGHYDKDGNYVSYDTNGRTVVDTDGNRTYFLASSPSVARNEPPPAEVRQTVTETYEPGPGDESITHTKTVTTYGYVKAGYYDANGFYIAPGAGPPVPEAMMPPPGLCRVWYPERAPQDEPGIQSCSGIRARVPMGAYVIYGG